MPGMQSTPSAAVTGLGAGSRRISPVPFERAAEHQPQPTLDHGQRQVADEDAAGGLLVRGALGVRGQQVRKHGDGGEAGATPAGDVGRHPETAQDREGAVEADEVLGVLRDVGADGLGQRALGEGDELLGQRLGRRQDYKKAYVRLAPGQSIDLTGAEA